VLLEGANGEAESIPNQNSTIVPTSRNDTQDLLDLLGEFYILYNYTFSLF